MVNLSLVELKSEEVNETKKDNLQSSLYMDFKPRNFNFIANVPSYKTSVNDVTDKITQGKYGLNSEYTMIYLYDYTKDTEAKNFIATYGGNLHTRSSNNITILTFFSKDMSDNWVNVSHRDEIKEGPNNDMFQIMDIINDLKDAYEVIKLPALVIIKKRPNGTEEHCTVDMSSYNAQNTYHVFKDIIEIITDNYEEEFSVIANKICGPVSKTQQGNVMSNFNTANYVGDLIKQERKQRRKRKLTYTQLDLAYELDLDDKSIRNKCSADKFSRDECIYIGVRFGVSVTELNALLRKNDHVDLGMDGRDRIIRTCLMEGKDVNETDKMLKLNHFPGIIRRKYSE